MDSSLSSGPLFHGPSIGSSSQSTGQNVYQSVHPHDICSQASSPQQQLTTSDSPVTQSGATSPITSEPLMLELESGVFESPYVLTSLQQHAGQVVPTSDTG